MDELEAGRLRIYSLQDGAIRAQALTFALRQGIFETLEGGALSFGQLCERCRLSPRVAPAVLAFLSSQLLVTRDAAGLLTNTPAASSFLVRASPDYIGGRALLFAGFYEAIAHLPEALTSGEPWTSRGQHDMFASFNSDDQRWFADGMFANAVHGGRMLAEQVDFSTMRSVLDVGGNAGGYAIALARKYSHLRITIVDLDSVRPLARERIAEAGLSSRITFHSGTFFEDALPRGYDALLLSSILHDWGDADCATILRHCFNATPPGRSIVVTEPMLADDYSGPDHPAASGLTMALLGGENRTRAGICRLLEAAGYTDCWMSDLLPQNSVVTARRPP